MRPHPSILFLLLVVLLTGSLPWACGDNKTPTAPPPTATPTPFPTPGLSGSISGYLRNTNSFTVGIVDANSGALSLGCTGVGFQVLSPDKQKVVYFDRVSGSIDLADPACSTVTQAVTNLTNWYIFNFAWSPDSLKVAMDADERIYNSCGGPAVDDNDLFVLDTTTMSFTNITNTNSLCNQQEYSPAWSSTGILGFGGNSSGGVHLYKMSPSGTGRSLINTVGPDIDYRPAWSPDGSQIAILSSSMIYIFTTGGAAVTFLNVSGAGSVGSDLGWSPDSQYIGFSAGTPSCTQIFAVNVTTGAIKQVSNVPCGTYPNGIVMKNWH